MFVGPDSLYIFSPVNTGGRGLYCVRGFCASGTSTASVPSWYFSEWRGWKSRSIAPPQAAQSEPRVPVSLTTWWCSKAASVCEMTA